jgi:hypothetical protein
VRKETYGLVTVTTAAGQVKSRHGYVPSGEELAGGLELRKQKRPAAGARLRGDGRATRPLKTVLGIVTRSSGKPHPRSPVTLVMSVRLCL